MGYKCVAVSDGLSPAAPACGRQAGAAGLDSDLRMTNANLATAFRRRQSPSRPTRWLVLSGVEGPLPPGLKAPHRRTNTILTHYPPGWAFTLHLKRRVPRRWQDKPFGSTQDKLRTSSVGHFGNKKTRAEPRGTRHGAFMLLVHPAAGACLPQAGRRAQPKVTQGETDPLPPLPDWWWQRSSGVRVCRARGPMGKRQIST